MTDDDQISALFEQMCRAWTAGDAVAYGRCFTPDCDYVSFDGYREQGRDAMVESHDRLFRGVLFGSALVGQVESIRHLADGVAVMHATGSVLVAWRKRLPKRRLTRNTIVAVRGPGGWRCARSTTDGSARWAFPRPTPSPPGPPACSSAPPARCTSGRRRRPGPPGANRGAHHGGAAAGQSGWNASPSGLATTTV